VTIHQGHDMGRPSLLTVTIPGKAGSGIGVTGTATRLAGAAHSP
jgi:predicted PhzF superfamily epimerase YddE/YHI9